MNKYASTSSVSKQLKLVFATSGLILIISSLASLYTIHKQNTTSQWVNHTNEILLHAEYMVSYIKDAETGQRGYVITGNNVFLQPYNGAYEKTIKEYEYIKSLTLDNPLQQKNLALAKGIIDKRFEQMQHIINLVGVSKEDNEITAQSDVEMLKGKQIMDDLRELINDIKAEEQRLLKMRLDEQELYTKYTPAMVSIVALISLLITVLSYFRIKKDLEERVQKQREDEEKYLDTTRRINDMQQVTQRIAAGDYTARSLDNAKDELGRIAAALNDMVVSLETSFNDLEHKSWMQAGAINISNAIRGERSVKRISEKIINSVASYVDAPVATLYIADKDLNLKLHGGYAESNAPEEILSGKGLIGQALRSKEVIVSDKLPADYLNISSSTGNTSSTYIIVLPLIYTDIVIGGIELGLLHEPQSAEVAFLKNNAETIAVGINAAINYEKIQDLLEETQAQAEELQAQHNELENMNAELEIQSEKLQASEEELRVQQEELQQTNNELEERSTLLEEKNQEIIEKNMEVQRKAEELAQSTKYKSEFLANMSHELRTPLNSILLLSRLLAENAADTLNKDQVEYAQVIQSSGNGLLSLIDEILDLSKIEAGKMQLEYEQVAIKEITNDMRSLFEPLAKEKKIDLKIDTNDAPQFMEVDKMRLEQILKNLLSNALKFTSQGSVELTVSKSTKEGFVDFVVADTGIGIADDKQFQIFEAFQQADGSTRRKYGGTGLGLSISKELAKLLGGDIAIQSQAGKGSTFTAFIPATKAYKTELADATPIFRNARPDIQTVTEEKKQDLFISSTIPESIPDDRAMITPKDKIILIVEDDTPFAKSLLDFTRTKGYKGIVCVRGDEGLALAKQFKPLGILLDIQLPIKSGWQVMEELKADAQTRHIPVHIMSSHSVKKESLLKGAINFIDKPVALEQMEEIFTKLEYVLNRKSKKVLIVEENPKHAKALSYFLETFHISADVKNTVAESIAALKKDVDCVILDMGIPDANAYNMLEEIKKNPGLENLPIIIFTGKSLSTAEEHRIKQYADSIVVKTAHSFQRILDEVSLFLHLVEENKPKASSNYKKLGALNDVLKDKTVLVVDDDVRNIFSLTKALEKANMNIITAVDGKEAMEKLQENKNIDVVLLDMMMPRMDGYETAKRIRQNNEWKKLPVIAVTAKAMTGDREKCIQAGTSDYITKPVDVDQLLSLLRVWLYEKS